MRDGVHLALDVLTLFPDRPLPVVLIRTPYNKRRWTGANTSIVDSLLRRGFAVAAQDVRGRNNSGGEWQMYFSEAEDGYDTIDWIATQAWCDGSIGMYGGSYEATVQWFVAALRNPHLKALVSIASTPNSLWRAEPLRGGAFLAPLTQYAVDIGPRTSQTSTSSERWWVSDRPSSMAIPFSDVPIAEGSPPIDWLTAMFDHPTLDEYWSRGEFDWHQIETPALHISGWWDMLLPGALENYPGLRHHAGSQHARDNQHLVIGPWAHHPNESRTLNGVNFGPTAFVDLDSLIGRFFDAHLKETQPLEPIPEVSVFVLGLNEWWEADQWPLAEVQEVRYYLDSLGSANSRHGDGALAQDLPAGARSDHFVYDPANPIYAPFDIIHDGPVDDRIPTERADVLCYSTPPLEEPLIAVGPVSAHIWASSSARDTDWHVRLVDVYPDGTARYLCHGVLRARFREGYRKSVELAPDVPTHYVIDMDAIANEFGVGHRVRLEFTSSWTPRYDRNLNSGARDPYRDTEVVVAHQAVHHDVSHRSHIVLPVIPTSSTVKP